MVVHSYNTNDAILRKMEKRVTTLERSEADAKKALKQLRQQLAKQQEKNKAQARRLATLNQELNASGGFKVR
jgi:uncharacterized coiled-coil protein SlyX